MARLSDLPPEAIAALDRLPLPTFDQTPWAQAPALREARVAIVSTAGLHRREDAVFQGGATDFRIIPGDLDSGDLVMSHVSANFDRSGFQQDAESIFPLGHLRALAADRGIASVAAWHYSFMGATDPTGMVENGHEVGRLLRADGVNLALLVPV
jgi:D-proline reductase (dithiol) PrdB